MDKRIPGILRTVLIGASLAVCGLLLWEKFQLGIHRYFDADEFAYLHWAHNIFAGRVPYRDFLAYVPPAFSYAVSFLYFFTDGVEILLIGRIAAFVVFMSITISLMYLFWQMRRNLPMAIVAGLLLVFIPIPADKFIEIRPDNLAMLVALIATILHITALSGKGTKAVWIAAGACYSLSLCILPKTLPQVIVAGIVTLLWMRWGEGGQSLRTQGVRSMVIGAGLPFITLCVWALFTMRSFDELLLMWYSLTRLPFEAQQISALFPLPPFLFFYPNELLYGAPGWNRVLMVNHALWGIGLMTGSIRLVTVFVVNGRKGVWVELLVSGAFLGYIISFMYGYPMRHEQYLIPIAVFVMFYAADVFGALFEWLGKKPTGVVWGSLFVGALIVGIWGVSRGVNTSKLRFTNGNDYTFLRFALSELPRDAYVFDLVGSTIYFRDPYYVSAVPFGQWEPYLSRPLPSLSEALERTGARYVYEGGLGRINNLTPEARLYIRDHFRPVNGAPGLYAR